MTEETYEERRAYKDQWQSNRDKRIAKMHKGLIDYGFKQINEYHYTIFDHIDYWPTKGKWLDRKTKARGQYLKYLKKYIKKNYKKVSE